MTGLDYFKDKRIEELEKENKLLKEKLDDFKNYGLRADLNPILPTGDWMEVTDFFLDYLKRIDSRVRERAELN